MIARFVTALLAFLLVLLPTKVAAAADPPGACVRSPKYSGIVDPKAAPIFEVFLDVHACPQVAPHLWTITVAKVRVSGLGELVYRPDAWIIRDGGDATSRRFALTIRMDICFPLKPICNNNEWYWGRLLIIGGHDVPQPPGSLYLEDIPTVDCKNDGPVFGCDVTLVPGLASDNAPWRLNTPATTP